MFIKYMKNRKGVILEFFFRQEQSNFSNGVLYWNALITLRMAQLRKSFLFFQFLGILRRQLSNIFLLFKLLLLILSHEAFHLDKSKTGVSRLPRACVITSRQVLRRYCDSDTPSVIVLLLFPYLQTLNVLKNIILRQNSKTPRPHLLRPFFYFWHPEIYAFSLFLPIFLVSISKNLF